MNAIARALLVMAAFGLTAQAQEPALGNGGFEEEGTGWEIASRGPVEVGWSRQAAEGRSCLTVVADSGEAVVCTEVGGVSWGMVLELQFRVRIEGSARGVRLLVDLVRPGTPVPRARPIWWGQAPADGKWHRMGLKLLLPPGPEDEKVRLCIGAGGTGTASLDDVQLVSAGKPRPGPTPPPPALPLGWQPDDLLDATVREIDEQVRYRTQVGPLEFTIEAEAQACLGGLASLQATIVNRDRGRHTVRLVGESSPGLAFAGRAFDVPMGTARTVVRLQGLLPGEHWMVLGVQAGSTEARLPLKAHVSLALPAFGITAHDCSLPPSAGAAWQLRELVLPAEQLSDVAEIVRRLNALAAERPAALAVQLGAPLQEEALRALVAGAAQAVTFWGPRWRPEAAAADHDVQALARELLQQTALLRQAVNELDDYAAVLSPAFHWEANDPQSPEGALLRACFEMGLAPLADALALVGPALPPFDAAQGGLRGGVGDPERAEGPQTGCTLLESLDGQLCEAPSAPWVAWDTDLYPAGVKRLREEMRLRQSPIMVSEMRCGACGDPWMDALVAARAAIIAAYNGAQGATFADGRPDEPWISLTGPDGTDSVAGWAVREVLQEVSGAAPLATEGPDAELSRFPGSRTAFRPFTRGDERIVCLWNNSSTPADIAIRLLLDPVCLDILDISYGSEEFVHREHVEPFRYQKDAIARQQRAEFVTIAPLQVLCLRFRFPPAALPTGTVGRVEFERVPEEERRSPLLDDRPWWQILQERFERKGGGRERE